MRAPDKVGQAAKAWKVKLSGEHNAANGTKVTQWYIHCPSAHPFWEWYAVSAIHLRDVEGIEPAKKYLPDATHEFSIIALNPNKPVDVDDPNFYFLLPFNFTAQMVYESDEAAVADVEKKAVEAIVHGLISPDTDYLSHWVAQFNSSMVCK